MSQKSTQPVRYQPRSFEMVLDFCVELSRRMIMSGANVERVNLAVDRVCSTYELDDVSGFNLLPIFASDETLTQTQGGYSRSFDKKMLWCLAIAPAEEGEE